MFPVNELNERKYRTERNSGGLYRAGLEALGQEEVRAEGRNGKAKLHTVMGDPNRKLDR